MGGVHCEMELSGGPHLRAPHLHEEVRIESNSCYTKG